MLFPPNGPDAPGNFPHYPSIDSGRVDVAKIAEYTLQYIKSDNLGVISNLHLAHADKFGARDPYCLSLAKHHSDAVDFVKTGVAPNFNFRDYKLEERPDFMENRVYNRLLLYCIAEQLSNL
jgi:RNA-dependent RNA polymerase